MKATYYANLLHCECLLKYQDFKDWLSDLLLPQAVRETLLARVQQTGGLEYNDWLLLLNNAQFYAHNATYFINQYNTCGFLCMGELVEAIAYGGEEAPGRKRIFSKHFSKIFN